MLIPSPCDGFIYLFIYFSLLSAIPINQIVNDEDVSGIRPVD